MFWLAAAAALLIVSLPVLMMGRLRIALLDLLPPQQRIAVWALYRGVEVDHGATLTLADGTRLAASVYLPKRRSGPLPTVLIRMPYHRMNDMGGYWSALYFARHGYAVVVQDLRGTGDSGGELLPWRDVGEDGVATLDWIVRQPWSDGKVGTFGCSALGETQFVLARKNHPAHRAMIPSGAGGGIGSVAGRYGYFGVFEGGVFQLASGFGWFVASGAKDPKALPARPFNVAEQLAMLPVSKLVEMVRPAPNGYSDFLATPLGVPLWEHWGYWSDADSSRVPAMVFNTWSDQTVGDTLALAGIWQRAGVAQKVVITPGGHCQQGRTPAPDGQDWDAWATRWFDHWLKGKPDTLSDLPEYNYFMLGEDRWYGADRWPPAGAQAMRMYLGSDGKANSRSGNGRLLLQPGSGAAAADEFSYDPARPVPSRGGPLCCTGNPNEPTGAVDQADVEVRDDVLVYTSEPMAQDLRIAGPLQAHIVLSSTAPDTDLVLRLVHVRPDGLATNIQEGALRLRYRNGVTAPQLIAPGERVAATVDMRSIAYLVPRGHRLRLHVTSSSFPRLERNLNTGAANNADETRMAVAVNRVHHAADTPSWVELHTLTAPP